MTTQQIKDREEVDAKKLVDEALEAAYRYITQPNGGRPGFMEYRITAAQYNALTEKLRAAMKARGIY